MVLLASSYANNLLASRMAGNEFSSNEQFMQTTGLQIDNVAWTLGRTQTIQYSSQNGQMNFQNNSLTYSFEVNSTGVWQQLTTWTTGMLMYNMPTSAYTLGNNYFLRLAPVSNNSFLQQGTSAPVSNVFAVEKLPMTSGSYARVVVVPCIRLLSFTVGGVQPQSYYNFYLPSQQAGPHPTNSQSITLTGSNLTKVVASGVNQVRLTVTFPSAGSGFNSSFFNFQSNSIVINCPNSVIELYLANVTVSRGVY